MFIENPKNMTQGLKQIFSRLKKLFSNKITNFILFFKKKFIKNLIKLFLFKDLKKKFISNFHKILKFKVLDKKKKFMFICTKL
jgi:hypothetical protein